MKLTAETTIFNDDKVQQKFSELIVDADGIHTEVSKKVGNDEVISRINQSAETVKIQASKVEVDGTLIVGKSAVDSAKAEAINASYNTHGLPRDNYNGHINVNANGALILMNNATYPLKAGNYEILAGVWA